MEQRYTLALEKYNSFPASFRDVKNHGLHSPFVQLQKKLTEPVLKLFEEKLAAAEEKLPDYMKHAGMLEEQHKEFQEIISDPLFPKESNSETNGVIKSKISFEEKLKKHNLAFDEATGKILLYRTQDSKNPVISEASVKDCSPAALKKRFESYKNNLGKKKRKDAPEKESDKNPTEIQQDSVKKPKESVCCAECTSTKLVAEGLCKKCLVDKYTSLTENLRSIGETFLQNVTDKEEKDCLKGVGGLWDKFEDDFEAFERLKTPASFAKFLKAFQNLKDIYNKVKPIPAKRISEMIGEESVSQHPKEEEEDEYEPEGIDDEEIEEIEEEEAPKSSHVVSRDLLAEFFEVFGDTSFNFQRLRDAYKKSPEVYRVVFEEIKALNCPMFKVVLIDNNTNKETDPFVQDICTQSLFYSRTDAENQGKSMTSDLNGLYRYEIREIPPRVA